MKLASCRRSAVSKVSRASVVDPVCPPTFISARLHKFRRKRGTPTEMHIATRRGRRSALQQLKISAETASTSSEVSCRRRRPRSSAEAVLASTEGARQPRKLTCVECSAEFGSFGSYLGSSPLCPCHRKSPCHRSSPRRRRRSKPQVAPAPSDVLSALPSDVVHAIVLACDGVASLAWCGSCKHWP